MKWFIDSNTLKSGFIKEVEKSSSQKIAHCYQCGKCSAGCPIAYEMEYTPNQIMRMIQLGMKDVVLASNTIWLCVSCITCTARCPREIDVAEVMDVLRRFAYRSGVYPIKGRNVPLFNKVFLRNIEKYGRLFEMSLIGTFNMLSGTPFKDTSLAPKMFLRHKINLLPEKVKGIKEIRGIFKKAGKVSRAKKQSLITIGELIHNYLKR